MIRMKKSNLIICLFWILLCHKMITSQKTSRATTTRTTTSRTTTTRIHSTSSNSNRDSFDSRFKDFVTKKNHTKLPKNRTIDRSKKQSNMRQTTDDAFNINDLTTFSLNLALETNLTNQTFTIDSIYCPFKTLTCNSSDKYRSFDGTCNNLKNPLYGSANTPFKRIFRPAYDDNFNKPRTLAISGNELPNPRTISLTISQPQSTQKLENNITHLYAIFGQFLTHDIVGTSATTDSNGDEVECPCGTNSSNCFNVKWPSVDSYLNQTCLKITRSSATFPDFNCIISYREQLNLLSSFIDGSGIYGMSSNKSSELRTFYGGLLKTSQGLNGINRGITNRTYLPLSNDTCSTTSKNPYKCFYAGEYRTSENLGLVSIHTLFNREHNRIAAKLAKINPSWSDETLYQETRRIVIAELQHIVYNEWLPMINGSTSLNPLNTKSYYTGYNVNTNPALSNEFSTAAFRMGHTLIRQRLNRYNYNQNQFQNKSYDFQESVFQSDMAYETNYDGLNSILSGYVNDLCWKFGTFGFELQNRLFGVTSNNAYTAVDLFATNLNRGRDHGLQPYIYYVKKCLNISIASFTDLEKLMNKSKIATLKSLYESVNDIDLYAGGLSERKVSDLTVVGPTFACIIMEQFADLKNGDRFYYENGPDVNPYPFTLDQLAEIKKVTIAGLICNNYDIPKIQANPFRNTFERDVKFNCTSFLDQIDLLKWSSVS